MNDNGPIAAVDRALIKIDEFPALVSSFVALVDVVAMETKKNRDDLGRAALLLRAWTEADEHAPVALRKRTLAFLQEVGQRRGRAKP